MKRSAVALASFLFGGAILAGACTVFDGLNLPMQDASIDTTPPPVEGGTDAQRNDGGAGFLSIDDAVRFCANAFKCPFLPSSTIASLGVPVDANHFSACVNWIAGPIPQDRPGIPTQQQWLSCAAKATTCQQATSCMWWEIVDPKDTRCNGYDGGKNGSCTDDGGTVLYCTDGIIAHCSHPGYAPGSKCLNGMTSEKRCATDKPPCTKTDTCMGTYEMYCGASGLYQGIDCAITGYTCGLDSMSGLIQCLTDGQLKTCNSAAVTCDGLGNWVQVCDGSQISEFKCNSIGGTCDTSGAVARCKLPNEACSPYVGNDQCSGDTISLCVGGQKTSFDCAKIGLKCLPANGPVSAHCG